MSVGVNDIKGGLTVSLAWQDVLDLQRVSSQPPLLGDSKSSSVVKSGLGLEANRRKLAG